MVSILTSITINQIDNQITKYDKFISEPNPMPDTTAKREIRLSRKMSEPTLKIKKNQSLLKPMRRDSSMSTLLYNPPKAEAGLSPHQKTPDSFLARMIALIANLEKKLRLVDKQIQKDLTRMSVVFGFLIQKKLLSLLPYDMGSIV